MEILSLGWRLSSLCPSELPLPWLGPAGTGRLSKDTARLVSSLASWPHSHLCVPVSSLNGHLPASPGWGPSIRQLGPLALCGPVCTGVSADVPPSCNSASCLSGTLDAELELCGKGEACGTAWG